MTAHEHDGPVVGREGYGRLGPVVREWRVCTECGEHFSIEVAA